MDPASRDGNARWETGALPAALREQVLDRDRVCRFCGGAVTEPAIHHIAYRSEGGLNTLDNLITVHWMYAPRCHEVIHSNKRLWQPLALQVVREENAGLTMLQLHRWAKRRTS